MFSVLGLTKIFIIILSTAGPLAAITCVAIAIICCQRKKKRRKLRDKDHALKMSLRKMDMSPQAKRRTPYSSRDDLDGLGGGHEYDYISSPHTFIAPPGPLPPYDYSPPYESPLQTAAYHYHPPAHTHHPHPHPPPRGKVSLMHDPSVLSSSPQSSPNHHVGNNHVHHYTRNQQQCGGEGDGGGGGGGVDGDTVGNHYAIVNNNVNANHHHHQNHVSENPPRMNSIPVDSPVARCNDTVRYGPSPGSLRRMSRGVAGNRPGEPGARVPCSPGNLPALPGGGRAASASTLQRDETTRDHQSPALPPRNYISDGNINQSVSVTV